MDDANGVKIVARGGLYSNENFLELSDIAPGSASRLVNYEPGLRGGYRRIDGFEDFDSTYDTVDSTNADGRILGLFIHRSTASVPEVYEYFAARAVKNFTYTATASQTAFSGNDDNARSLVINVPDADVVVTQNGTTLTLTTDYTISGNTVTLTSGATLNDTIVIDVGEYNFYKYDSSSGWQIVSTGETHQTRKSGKTINKVRTKEFTEGNHNFTVLVDGVNFALLYDGTNWNFIKSTNAGTSRTDAGGATAIDAPSCVTVFQRHIFVGGDPDNPGIIAHSAPLTVANGPYKWTSADGGGQVLSDFVNIQLYPFRQVLYVFGFEGLQSVTTDGSNFGINNVGSDIGCVSADSVFELGGDVYFLAADGYRPITGTDAIGDVELNTISKPIQQLLRDSVANNDMEDVCTVVIRTKSQFRFFISGASTSVAASKGILGGFRTSDQQLSWEFGEILGIRASVAHSRMVGKDEVVLHGDYNGKVYRQENEGESFDGTDITSVYSTPYLDFGDPEANKNIKKIKAYIRTEGAVDLFTGIDIDYGDPDVIDPPEHSESLQGFVVRYSSGVQYNQTGVVYGGAQSPFVEIDRGCQCKSIRVTFVTKSSSKPHTIQGLSMQLNVRGTRK